MKGQEGVKKKIYKKKNARRLEVGEGESQEDFR